MTVSRKPRGHWDQGLGYSLQPWQPTSESWAPSSKGFIDSQMSVTNWDTNVENLETTGVGGFCYCNKHLGESFTSFDS